MPVTFFDEKPTVTFFDEDETYFREDTGRIISAPSNLNANEVEFLDNVQNNGRDASNFFGMLEPGFDFASRNRAALKKKTIELARGIVASPFLAGLPSVTADAMQRHADQMQEELDKPFGARTILGIINPKTDIFVRIGKVIKTKEALGLKVTEDLKIPERMNRVADAQRLRNQEFLQRHNLVKGEDDGIIFDLGQAGTSVLTSMAITVLTKNPFPASVLFAELQRTTVYKEAIDAGKTPAEARGIAFRAGVGEGIIESIGGAWFLKLARESKPLTRTLLRATGEGLQEFTQTGIEELNLQLEGVRDVDVERAVKDMFYSALLGFIAGVPSATIVSVAEKQAKEKGSPVTPDQARRVTEEFVKNKEEIVEEAAQIIESESSPLVEPVKTESETAKAIKDLVIGEIAKEELTELELAQREAAEKILEVEERKDRTDIEIIKGRQKKIDEEISAIDKQIGIAESLREERLEAEKSVKALDNKIDQLLERRTKLDIERGLLLELPIAVIKVPKKKEISIKAQVLEKLGIKAREEKIRSFQKGLREGIRIAKTDIKATQTIIIKAIKESGLSLNDQAKFLSAVKNIQTPDQALKQLPIINSRISALLEKSQRRQIKSAIKKALKKTKIRKVAGKPVSKFAEAEIQASLDILREATTFTQEQAASKIISNLEIGADITVDMAMENRLLSIMADTGSVPLPEMIDVLVGINELILTGKTTKKLKDLQRRERLDITREQFIDGITRGRDLENISKLDVGAKFEKVFNEIRAAESGLNNGWFDTLDLILGKASNKLFNITLDPKVSEGDRARDTLIEAVAKAINTEKGLAVEFHERFVQIGLDSFGLKNSRQLQRKFIRDERVELIGVFKREGKEKATRWELSRAQARKLWMELQDPTIRETLTAEKGNGITEEMETVLQEDFLSDGDKLFAQAQLDFYKELYPRVDTVYAGTYGVHLPNNPFYSPIRREFRQQIGNTNDFLEELKARQSTVPSFGKLRTNSKSKIVEQSDITAMMNHIAQSSHFIAMSETARDLNSIFTTPEIRKSIEATFGKTMLTNIDSYIQDFTSGHVQRAEDWSRILNTLNKNFVVSALGLKINLWPKQMSSIFAFANDIPITAYAKGLVSFAANPKKAIDILSKTPFMQTRGASQDVEIVKGAQQQAGKLFGKKQTIDNALLITTRLGDRGAIYFGGWAVYQHNIAQGKTKEEALKAFVESARATQQSSDLDQLSRIQASKNPFYRAMSMFMSAPNAYWRAEKRAIRQLIRGKITPQEAGKKIFIFHFLLPMLFQYISDGFDFDEKNQTRAAVLGSLNGFIILGSVLVDAGAAAQGIYFKRDDLNFVTGVSDLFLAGARSFKNGEIEIEDILIAAGQVSGAPVKQIINIVEGIEDINKDDPVKGIKRVLGWTKNTISKPKKQKREKPKGKRKEL